MLITSETLRVIYKIKVSRKKKKHTSCPGTVDQKNPLQSGSSKMYGTNRVNRRTQFRTETKQKSEQ